MNNIKRKENDRGVLQCLLHAQISKGVGFNDIKRGIGKDPETTSKSLGRLTKYGFIIKKGGLYYLSLKGDQFLKDELPESDFTSYERVDQTNETKQKIRNTVTHYWERRKAETERLRVEEQNRRITFFVLWNAGNGVTFETVLSKRKPSTRPIKITPSTKLIEVLFNQPISPRPHTKVNRILLDTARVFD